MPAKTLSGICEAIGPAANKITNNKTAATMPDNLVVPRDDIDHSTNGG